MEKKILNTQKYLVAIIVALVMLIGMPSLASAVEEFDIKDGVLVQYNGNLAYVTIPSNVTTIGNRAFDGNKTIKSILIGKSVKVIEEFAFANCKVLGSITIPDNVTRLGNNAFQDSKALETVIIGNGITMIEHTTFWGCLSLNSVVLGNKLNIIDSNAFQDCKGLKQIKIPNTVVQIGAKAFSGSGITSIIIPKGVKAIESETFSDSALNNIVIPNTVRVINKKAFMGSALTKIEIPNTVRLIESEAFRGCYNLQSVIIPSSVTDIGKGAFSYCEKLTTVTIPSNVVRIDSGAFYNWKLSGKDASVDTLTITCVKGSKAQTFAQGKGYKTNLITKEQMNLKAPLNKAAKGAYDDYLILNGTLRKYYGTETTVTIPSGIKEIFEGAFADNKTIQKVIIPQGVTKIASAFKGCSNLKGVVIPKSVINMQEAFQNCSKLNGVVIPKSVTNIQGAFSNCIGLTRIIIPEGVTNCIGAFSGCKNLTSVTIPKSFSEISNYLFENCNLKKVTIPSSVTTIGYKAFTGNKNLTEITLPEGLKIINTDAFSSTGLTEVVIPESVTEIGYDSFSYNPKLTAVVITGMNTQVPISYGNKYSIIRNSDNAVIYCLENSAMHNYAKAISMKYQVIPMDGDTTNSTVDPIATPAPTPTVKPTPTADKSDKGYINEEVKGKNIDYDEYRTVIFPWKYNGKNLSKLTGTKYNGGGTGYKVYFAIIGEVENLTLIKRFSSPHVGPEGNKAPIKVVLGEGKFKDVIMEIEYKGREGIDTFTSIEIECDVKYPNGHLEHTKIYPAFNNAENVGDPILFNNELNY